jgi:hypothetical protein
VGVRHGGARGCDVAQKLLLRLILIVAAVVVMTRMMMSNAGCGSVGTGRRRTMTAAT